MTSSLPEFVQHLMDPASYPHAAADLHLIQTHISYVFLAGDSVYKFKKPMDFGFLDFSTLEKRKYFCEQELTLNRRLCPTIYLDLVSVNKAGAALSLNGPGEPLEYGIRMVRMPTERMMNRVIRAGDLTHEILDNIVDILVPFYERAASGPQIDALCTAEAVSVNVLENLAQSEQFVGCSALSRAEYDAIGNYAVNFLKDTALFEQRIVAGRAKDCHGDLHSANICLADQVYIYDCIEFNERFRYSDVANDVAFLAMDLDDYGLETLSEYFINRFQEASGDSGLRQVLNFYKCYRATVRGKIGLLTAHEEEVDDATRAESLNLATQYFRLAQRYAEVG